MAIITTAGHVDNAIRFFNQSSNMWVGLGKSDSAWSNENVPDPEDSSTTKFTGLLGMRKATDISLAIKVPTGTTGSNIISYGGETWQLVSASDAQSTGANYVYVSTTIGKDELTSGTYRQVGLFLNPTFKTGVTAVAVTGDNVVSQGTLEMYENRTPLNKTNADVIERFILKF